MTPFLFLDNKYTCWYARIILKRQQNPVADGVYTEEHHIIPESMGGTNNQLNLVKLTAREHFVVHWLLRKMTTGSDKGKMTFAHKRLCGKTKNRDKNCLNSKSYAKLKKEANEAMKIWWSDPENKQKYSDTNARPEIKQKRSKAMKIWWSDSENKQKQRDTNARPETKQKHRKAMKIWWSDIDRRQRQREARSCPVNQLDRLTEKIINTFVSIDEASRKTGANGHCISWCCRCKLKTSGGFKWEFAPTVKKTP